MTSSTPPVLALPGASTDLTSRLQAGLEQVEALIVERTRSEDDFITEANLHLAKAGGKRFRPMLTMLVAELGEGINDRVIAAAAGVELTVRAGKRAPWHPGRCAELFVTVDGEERVIGHAGELHPRVCAALELPARTSVMELDVDALPAAPVPVGPSISAFPPVFVDLAFVVDDEVPAAEVERTIRAGAGALPMDHSLEPPKPPSPRALSGSSLTTSTVGSAMGRMMSCAIFWPAWMRLWQPSRGMMGILISPR